MSRYSKPELTAILQKELRQSLGAPGTEISRIRLRNLQYFKAEATGELAAPDIPDRSSIVASDAADTVEWMLPSLLRPFVTAHDAMECEPQRPQFEPQAKLASEYLRWLFWKKNKGDTILYQWFKDALIQKVGFVKVIWDVEEIDAEETYRDLLPEQVQELLQDEDVEPVSKDSRVELIGGQPVELYEITVKRKEKKGACKILPCPPEEMRVHPRSRYGEPLTFIAQQFYRTRAELEADGYDLANVSAEDGWHMEQIERASTQTPWFFDQSDGELQRYLCSECYIRLDQDNDGIVEWRKVFMIGQTVMDDDKVDDHPFVYFCPQPMPHVFFGECPVDDAIQPQRLRTSLMRAILDNVYLSVNKRMGIVEGQVNIDDLINNRPGGVVRMKSRDALLPIEQGGLDASAWNMVEWAETWREQRTGYTRYSQGLSPDALNPTATGVSIITEKADQRMELISRVAAVAVENLFTKMLKCVSMYQDKAEQINLLGSWLNIDPREWKNAFQISINVGLGTGSKDKQSAVMNQIYMMQAPLLQAGAIPPQAAIMAARKFAESAGISAPEQYFPDAQPPQPQPNPEQIKAQAQMQSDAAKLQANQQLEQFKAELQARVDQNRQEQEARQHALKVQAEKELEAFRAQLEGEWKSKQLDLDKYKADLSSQTTILVEQMRMGQKRDEMSVDMQKHADARQDAAQMAQMEASDDA